MTPRPDPDDAGDGTEEDVLRVLLVEDNPGDATLVEHHLRQGSVFDVADEVTLTHVETVEAATDRLGDGEFDLVLLDLGLPGSTGIDTLDRLPEAAEDLPVVVLTGLDDHGTAVEAIQRGAQDYLPKDDLDTDRLMRSIRYAVERHKQAMRLRRQNHQLELFNSVLRHDVQNGMDVIHKHGTVLSERLSGDERDHAETIVSWSDDMIDLTRKVQGMLSAVTDDARDVSRVDIAEPLREQVDRVAAMEGVTVEASIPEGVTVEADRMLSAVFGNVLTNAVEHNDSDDPEVTVDVVERDGTVHVRVADNGPGIPAGLRESVFGRGVQADPDGGGFGLYFVATMVEGYGGEVTVEDNDPRGTVFDIALPAAQEAWSRTS
jgi:signal transduction histidine kinase